MQQSEKAKAHALTWVLASRQACKWTKPSCILCKSAMSIRYEPETSEDEFNLACLNLLQGWHVKGDHSQPRHS